MTCNLKKTSFFQRVIALVFVFLFAFTMGIQPIAFAYAADAQTYYIQTTVDTSNWTFVGAVVNDKKAMFGNYTETERIGSDKLKKMLASNSKSMFSDMLNSDVKKGSGGDKKYRVLSFPGFDTKKDAGTWTTPQASSAQMDRATFVKDSLIYDLNTAIKTVYGNKSYDSLSSFQSDVKSVLSAAQNSGTVNGWKFTRASDSKLNDSANEISASDYVIVSKGNDKYTFLTGAKKYLKSMPAEDKPKNSGDDTTYITWGMIAYEAIVNATLEKDAVTTETVYNATTQGVLESAITDVMTALVGGVRSLLGLWDLDSLIFNKGVRGSAGYVSGIFPSTWEPFIWSFFLISEILSLAIILYAIGKQVLDRANATVNPIVRANAMEQVKDMILTIIVLVLLPALIVGAMKLSASLTNVFSSIIGEKTITEEIGHFPTGSSLAAVVVGILNLIINIYFNWFYIIRSITVAILIGASPLFVSTMCLGQNKRATQIRWLGELACNIFMQPIHAFIFSFIIMIPKTGRAIESLILLYAVIPLTAMFKGLIFPGSGELTHRAADQAGRTTGNIAKAGVMKATMAAAGGAKGALQGVMAGNRAESDAAGGASSGATDSGKGDASVKQKNVDTNAAKSTPADSKSAEMDKAKAGAGDVSGNAGAGSGIFTNNPLGSMAGAYSNAIKVMGNNLTNAITGKETDKHDMTLEGARGGGVGRSDILGKENRGGKGSATGESASGSVASGAGEKQHPLAEQMNTSSVNVGNDIDGNEPMTGSDGIATKVDPNVENEHDGAMNMDNKFETGEPAEGPDNLSQRYDAYEGQTTDDLQGQMNIDDASRTGVNGEGQEQTFQQNMKDAMREAKTEIAADKASDAAVQKAAMDKKNSPDARIKSAKRRMVAAAALTGAVRGWHGQIFSDPTRGGTMMNNAQQDLRRAYEDKKKQEQSSMDNGQRTQAMDQMAQNLQRYKPGESMEKPMASNDAAALGRGDEVGANGSQISKEEAEMAGITNLQRTKDGMSYDADLNKLPEDVRNNMLDAGLTPEGKKLAEEQGYQVDLHHRKNPETGKDELTGKASVKVGKNGITGQNAPSFNRDSGTISSGAGDQSMLPNMNKLKQNADDRKAYDDHFNAQQEHERAINNQIAPVTANYDQQSQALTAQTMQAFDMMQDKNGVNKQLHNAVGNDMARNDAVSASAAFGYTPDKVGDANANHAYEATYDAPTLQTKGIKDFQMSDDGRTATYTINPNDKAITNPDMIEAIDSIQNPHSGYSQQAILDRYAKQGTEIQMNSDDNWTITQHAKTSEGFAMTSGNYGSTIQNSGGTSFVASEKNESFVPTPIRQHGIKQGANIDRIQSQKQTVLTSNYNNQVEEIKMRNPAPAMSDSAIRGYESAQRVNYTPQAQTTVQVSQPTHQPPVQVSQPAPQPTVRVSQPAPQPTVVQTPTPQPTVVQSPTPPPVMQPSAPTQTAGNTPVIRTGMAGRQIDGMGNSPIFTQDAIQPTIQSNINDMGVNQNLGESLDYFTSGSDTI